MNAVLDPVEHNRLVADLEHVCVVANVQPKFVRNSMVGVAEDGEIEWVRGFRHHRAAGLGGLAIVGGKNVETRCQSICGALIRNFIDARIYPVNTLLDMQEKGELPEPTVMIIPNLFLSSAGKSMPAWKIQVLYDVLLSRLTAGKPTVVYVESMAGLAAAYGPVFHDHLSNNYKQIT